MRYFLELSYKGTHYAGFQVQENAPTIQLEVEKALLTFYREHISLTGSSRTDSGVHARQNFFHLDTGLEIIDKHVYNINAILPNDIYIKRIFRVSDSLHSRFNATHRRYHYYISKIRDPFEQETSWYYPYNVNFSLLQETAAKLMQFEDFTSFSKRNTQTFTRRCTITISEWKEEGDKLMYIVQSNRFLRGMVRALVATQLQVARGKKTIEDFRKIIESKNCANADFSTPPHGLFLEEVGFRFGDQ